MDLVFQTGLAAHPGHPALVHRVASHRVLPFAGDQLAVLVLVRSAIGNLDEPVRMPLLHFTGEPGFLDGRHEARKSVVSGKRVSGRVEYGGSRMIKTEKK